MYVRTTRFGRLALDNEDVLQFPTGLIGLEDCQRWVLLADAGNSALGWLQSTTRPDVALAVVSPRRFVSGFQFRAYRSALAPLGLSDVRRAQVLVIASKHDAGITLNLKAPIVLNLERRTGMQLVANDDHPVQFALAPADAPRRLERRRSA